MIHSDRIQLYLKLRGNIDLEGDLVLARMELSALGLDGFRDMDCSDVLQDAPFLSRLSGGSAVNSHLRANGTQFFGATGTLENVRILLARASFVQGVYAVLPPAFLAIPGGPKEFFGETQDLFRFVRYDGQLLGTGVPRYALFELSDVVARTSTTLADLCTNLDALVDYLLGLDNGARARSVGHKALSAKQTTSHLTHDMHYYKAKFFPRLARSALNMLWSMAASDSGPRVLDNFVGSGTTNLEARLLGLQSTGLDIDPLSTLIADAKTSALELPVTAFTQEAKRIVDRLTGCAKRPTLFDDCPRDDGQVDPVSVLPVWLLKNRRMTPDNRAIIAQELGLGRSIIAGSSPSNRRIIQTLVSDAISRRVRMRLLGTGVGRFSLTFSKQDFRELLISSLKRFLYTLSTVDWLQNRLGLNLAPSQIRIGDARRLPVDIGTFDAVLTSPPYLPASSGRESYTKARALSLLALDLADVPDVDRLVDDVVGSMIGYEVDLSALTAREQRVVRWLMSDELRSPKAAPVARYFSDMKLAFAEMYRVLSAGSTACIVVNKQSTFYRFSTREVLCMVPSAEIMADAAQAAGFCVSKMVDLKLAKGNRNARPRSLDDYFETLLFLRKS